VKAEVCLKVGRCRKHDVLARGVISGCSREKQVCVRMIALVLMWELEAKVAAVGILVMLMQLVRIF
jgi:hypothetical protein